MNLGGGIHCCSTWCKIPDTIVFHELVKWRKLVFTQSAKLVLGQIGGTVPNRERHRFYY